MLESERAGFVAECFWPGVTEADVEALDARAFASAEELSGPNGAVRYLGSILMREDEVVLCQFEGSPETVREVAERAQIPFERLLETVNSRWPAPGGGTTSARQPKGEEGT
jgi:hypothetical protein